MFLIIFFTLIVIIIINYIRNNNDKTQEELGNIPYVSSFPTMWALIRKKPHDEVEDIMSRASGDHEIYLTRFGPFKQINIVSPNSVKDLLMASENVAPKIEFHPGNALHDFFGKGLPFSNGDLWKTYRRMATPAFNTTLRPDIIGDTTMELFSFIEKNLSGPVDIFTLFQRITIEILGKIAFDYQFGLFKSLETPHIIKVYKYLIEYAEYPPRIIFPFINKLPLESNRKFRSYIEEFDNFVFEIIEKKKDELKNNKTENKSSDLLTKMLEYSEQEGIHTNEKQLRDEMVNFFVAGHDTTAIALTTSLYYLARYPEMQERARSEVINILGEKLIIPTSEQLKEMNYINAIIKETLRIHPPTTVMNLRRPTKPVKAGAYVIPKDSLCIVNIWQIHHNPKFWENPKQYNPDRFLKNENEKRNPFSWIPFSAGHRNCIGQNFTLLEQRIILSMFLLKYKWTLPEDSINKEKLMFDSQFLLRPVNFELLFTER